MNHLDDNFSVETPNTRIDEQRIGLRTASSTGEFMYLRNASQKAQSNPRSVQVSQGSKLDEKSIVLKETKTTSMLNNTTKSQMGSFKSRNSLAKNSV
jgi:hypothetical protein